MDNPFEFGRELGPGELVDRDAEVRALVGAMTQAGKLFLIGPRRYGKTSILRVAAERAEHRGAVVLRYDAEAFPTTEQLAARIAADAATRLTRGVQKAGEAIRDLFASLRPSASYDAVHHRWTVSFTRQAHEPAGVPLLADVLSGVERGAAARGKPVAVVLDECQAIFEGGGASAEAQLRAVVQRHAHVGYVFAGSKTRLLAAMVGDPGRPFYKLGELRFLGPIPRDEFARFLARRFTTGRIPVKPGAVDAILDDAEEVPYNVQLLAHECWESCRAGPSPRSLTPGLVRETRDTIARRSDPLYTQLWAALPTSQQKALVALLRERGQGLASSAVAQRHGILVPSMQKALKALEDKSIIREEQREGEVRLRFEDPFFATWISLVVPE